MTMRVAFVLPSFSGGGAERVVLTLLRVLDRSRVEPILVVLNGEGPLVPLVPPDVEGTDLGRPRLRQALPALIGVLRKIRPDAVVSTLGYVNIALLAARPLLKGRPKLILREANRPSVSIAAAPWPFAMRLAYRRLYPKAAAVLCNAGTTADELHALIGVPHGRIVHLPNPVDAARLRTLAEPLLRESERGVRFVASGRLTRQKGFDRLVEMMAALPEDARLVILGEGPDEAALKARIEALGLHKRVRLAGFEPLPYARYGGADAFLLPSRWEGQANAALEALALGTPVIATPEAGGIAEVAAAAPPGAVTIAPAGEPFIAAMRGVRPDPPMLGPRPSLLPEGYAPEAVAAHLLQVLEGGA
ncbi:MAG: glycosyltransferase [Alphaproteobacteria bacterium]